MVYPVFKGYICTHGRMGVPRAQGVHGGFVLYIVHSSVRTSTLYYSGWPSAKRGYSIEIELTPKKGVGKQIFWMAERKKGLLHRNLIDQKKRGR